MIQVRKTPEAVALNPNRLTYGNPFCLNTFLVPVSTTSVHTVT